MKDPRQYSIVKFDFDELPEEYHSGYPFIPMRMYIYLGEIPNMLGHCIVMDRFDGTMHVGFHIENFKEMTEDEMDNSPLPNKNNSNKNKNGRHNRGTP